MKRHGLGAVLGSLLVACGLSPLAAQPTPGPATSGTLPGTSPRGLDQALVGEAGAGGSDRLASFELLRGRAENGGLAGEVQPQPFELSFASACWPLTHGPRLEGWAGNAARLLIPGFGAVYHVRLSTSGNFAFLRVDVWGQGEVLIERPADEGQSPFGEFVEASARGWVALTWDDGVQAHVSVFELSRRVESTQHWDKTPVGPWDEASADSLTFAADRLYFSDESAPRSARLDGSFLYGAPALGPAPATVIPLPPTAGVTPTMVGSGIARSLDGTTIAFLASNSQLREDMYALNATTGQAYNATNNQQTIASILDDLVPGAARFAVSSDRVAYLVVSDVLPDELFVSQFGGAPPPPKHVTSSTQFVDSIDTPIGLVIESDRLWFHAGQTLTEMDVYRADLEPAVFVRNLTQTSGDSMAPFDKGATLHWRRLWIDAEGSAIVHHSYAPGVGEVFTEIDRATGQLASAALFAELGEFRFVPGTASYAFVGRTVGGSAQQLFYRDTRHVGAPLPVTQHASGTKIRGLVIDLDRRFAAWMAGSGPGAEQVCRMDLPSLSITPLGTPSWLGDNLAVTAEGTLLFAKSATPSGQDFYFQNVRGGAPRLLLATPGSRIWNP